MKLLLAFLLCTMPAMGAILDSPTASRTDVNTTVGSAARGDTVRIPNGTPTWSSAITLAKGITIKPINAGGVTITVTATAFDISPDSTAIANSEMIRVEGLIFDANNSAVTGVIDINGASCSGSTPYRDVVVFGNTFKNNPTAAGVVTVGNQVRGVIASNTFDRVEVVMRNFGGDSTNCHNNFPYTWGSSNTLFFEGNLIKWSSSMGGMTDPGWIENGQSARVCIRYNKWDWANLTDIGSIIDIHGFQYWTPEGQTGTMLSEIYGNTFTNAVGNGEWFFFRGVEGAIFNNLGYGAMPGINMAQYTNACNTAVGASTGVPGNFPSQITNFYCFNNTDDGTQVHTSIVSDANDINCPPTSDLSYFNYTNSFTGVAGIGTGTSLPGGSPSKGVGFWVATDPNPTTDPAVIQCGTLYYAATAGSYSVLEAPFIFPHPILGYSAVGGCGGGSSPSGGVAARVGPGKVQNLRRVLR